MEIKLNGWRALLLHAACVRKVEDTPWSVIAAD